MKYKIVVNTGNQFVRVFSKEWFFWFYRGSFHNELQAKQFIENEINKISNEKDYEYP